MAITKSNPLFTRRRSISIWKAFALLGVGVIAFNLAAASRQLIANRSTGSTSNKNVDTSSTFDIAYNREMRDLAWAPKMEAVITERMVAAEAQKRLDYVLRDVECRRTICRIHTSLPPNDVSSISRDDRYKTLLDRLNQIKKDKTTPRIVYHIQQARDSTEDITLLVFGHGGSS